MTRADVEGILTRMGVAYYCKVSKLPELIGVSMWRIRAALDSRSLPRSGRGTIARADLVKWITGQPAVMAHLFEAQREMDGVTAPTGALAWSAAAMRDNVSVTVNGRYYAETRTYGHGGHGRHGGLGAEAEGGAR